MTNESGNHGTMAERVAATRKVEATQLGHGAIEGLRKPPAPDPMAPVQQPPRHDRTAAETATYVTTEPCHVRVATTTGYVPGLLVEWRQIDGAWEGRAWHPERIDGSWIVIDQWVPARWLIKGDTTD